jgi:hypothetical protein
MGRGARAAALRGTGGGVPGVAAPEGAGDAVRAAARGGKIGAGAGVAGVETAGGGGGVRAAGGTGSDEGIYVSADRTGSGIVDAAGTVGVVGIVGVAGVSEKTSFAVINSVVAFGTIALCMGSATSSPTGVRNGGEAADVIVEVEVVRVASVIMIGASSFGVGRRSTPGA